MAKLTLSDYESRPGFYRNPAGIWRPERRKNADRRADTFAGHFRGLRTVARRVADQEMLAYLEQGADRLGLAGDIEFLPQSAG